jgi:hypothetical protein
MIRLSQNDPAWAGVTLDSTKFTIARYGCTTTGISMLSDYFHCFQPPDAIAKEFLKYTDTGLVLWSTLTLPKMMFKIRLRARDDKAILESLKNLEQAVLLNVSNGSHWTVAIRKAAFRNDYWCVDPWDGKIKLAAKTYRNIVGSAHFESKAF